MASSSPPRVPILDVVAGRDVVGREPLFRDVGVEGRENPKRLFEINESNTSAPKLHAANCPFEKRTGEAEALRANSARAYNPASERHFDHVLRMAETDNTIRAAQRFKSNER
jgi:plasmid replication initiation protein